MHVGLKRRVDDLVEKFTFCCLKYFRVPEPLHFSHTNSRSPSQYLQLRFYFKTFETIYLYKFKNENFNYSWSMSNFFFKKKKNQIQLPLS